MNSKIELYSHTALRLITESSSFINDYLKCV